MNYRKLFMIAVMLNIVLAIGAYWIWKSTRPAPSSTSAVEHSPME